MLAHSSLLLVFSLVLLPVSVPAVCVGQQSQEDSLRKETGGHPPKVLQRAKQLVKSGDSQRAIHLLRPVFEGDSPRLTQDEKAKVAYWLSRAHLEQGHPQQAFAVLRAGGPGSAEVKGLVDLQVADLFVREVMRQPSAASYERAARLYLRLLERSGEALSDEADRVVLHRHLRELAVILPKDIRERTGIALDATNLEIDVNPTSGAGELLVRWWRRQDPIPATRQNERIHEHLQRVAHAREQLTHEGQLDDRGKVYIRFGEPHRDVSIGMEHHETVDAIDTRIRRNEFWTYHHVHPKAYFLFVEVQPNEFQLSGAHDLFPPDVKTGVTGATSRSQQQALNYLYMMEKVMVELATFHEDYSTRAADVFNRAAWARDNEQYDIGPDPIDGPAGDFVQSMESRIESIERQNATKRAEEVPQSYTTISKDLPDLPVASRIARFLTPEGNTKVKVYWSIPSSALSLTDDLRERTGYDPRSPAPRFLLRATVVQQREDYREDAIRKRQFVARSSDRQGAILSPRTFTTTTDDSLFHLALQWDQFAARKDEEGSVQPGRALRRHTERRDTLTALNSDPGTLEMSDLRVLTVPSGSPEAATVSDEAIPYPFEQIQAMSPLALNFQVYHLGLNDEERTRYTISYGVRRQEEGSKFFGLFEDGEEEETITTSTYQGNRRRTDEYILLDLDEFAGDASGTVEVTVRVRDEVRDQQVARSVAFELIPATGGS